MGHKPDCSCSFCQAKRGEFWTEERCASQKGKPSYERTPEMNKANSERQKKRYENPAERAKISAALTGNPNVSAAQKRSWQDSEHRENRIAGIVKHYEDSKAHEVASAVQFKRYEDPAERASLNRVDVRPMLLLDALPLGRQGSQHGEGQHASGCAYHAHQSQARRGSLYGRAQEARLVPNT
jgi:hypothetical protein